MNFLRVLFATVVVLFPSRAAVSAATLLAEEAGPGDFPLVAEQHAAPFILDASLPRSVTRAVEDLQADIARVTGVKPSSSSAPAAETRVVIVGVLGHSTLLDQLAATGKIATQGMAGEWESYVIQTVRDPLPSVKQALVIAGSDPRGAIYGLYEISESIGVSPWCWWADVPVQKRPSLALRGGIRRQASPAVKYRGIFINDEDWGLQPWAAKTFEPETGDIGPKTYAKVFELLLRLRANTCWPAMHPSTRAFNHYPANKQVADDYGIVRARRTPSRCCATMSTNGRMSAPPTTTTSRTAPRCCAIGNNACAKTAATKISTPWECVACTTAGCPVAGPSKKKRSA